MTHNDRNKIITEIVRETLNYVRKVTKLIVSYIKKEKMPEAHEARNQKARLDILRFLGSKWEHQCSSGSGS